ncbi:CcoQ/FixQ family Cbb3-type cytochrome c oxidase assembly chaperone [Dyella sp. EPa41]|uniref:cbb3-type cytochrome oxidase subunit 3 n=1 Tax=Dyella sp. EPa41 TaxID=1561194 RepID=UPI001916ACD2|nr:CcoQ/FixQ family Cbb3-type cytochrome c oxidase assembly chaperone [Dyella sp. EPa41]
MSEIWGHLTGVIIVTMMVAFVCIWAWAWSGYHKKAFSRMAELPMEDEADNGQDTHAIEGGKQP